MTRSVVTGTRWQKNGNKMNGNLANILELKDLSEANEDFSLVNENAGYDPYDNPGTHKEIRDEAD